MLCSSGLEQHHHHHIYHVSRRKATQTANLNQRHPPDTLAIMDQFQSIHSIFFAAGGISVHNCVFRGNTGSPTVFEQDSIASDTGGYRLHLTEESLEALRRLLPADLCSAIESSGAPPETFRHLAIFDHHAKCRAPSALEQGLGLSIGPKGTGMFLALHRPRTVNIAPGAIVEAPYLVWSVL
jgi:hypothetical protein